MEDIDPAEIAAHPELKYPSPLDSQVDQYPINYTRKNLQTGRLFKLKPHNPPLLSNLEAEKLPPCGELFELLREQDGDYDIEITNINFHGSGKHVKARDATAAQFLTNLRFQEYPEPLLLLPNLRQLASAI